MTCKRWHVLTLLYLSCTQLLTVAGSNRICGRMINYDQYKIQPVGCDDVYGIKAATLCALECSSITGCLAFTYNAKNHTCRVCEGHRISDLKFSPNDTYFFQRHACWDPKVDTNEETSKIMHLPDTVVPGMMFQLSIISRNSDINNINFEDISGSKLFHFSAKMRDKDVVLTSKYNGKWGPIGGKISRPFPFRNGRQTEIHFLITSDRFKIYLEREYRGFFEYIRPESEIAAVALRTRTDINTLCY